MAVAAFLQSIPKFSEASQIIPTVNALVAAINSTVITPINSVIYPTIPSAPVNLLGVTVGNTGDPVILTPNGAAVDTNAGLIALGRGSGVLSLGGAGTSATASLRVLNRTNSANWLQVTGSTSAVASVQVETGGASTDIGLQLHSSGAGVISLGGTDSASASLRVITVASATRQVTVSGANGTAPTIGVTAGGALIISTGSTTFGTAANVTHVDINGTGSGSGAGGYLNVQNGGSSTILIGNKSAIAGGTYDANALMQTSGSLTINANGGNPIAVLSSAGTLITGFLAVAGATSAAASLQVPVVTNAANFVQISGATSATAAVEVAAVGATTDLQLKLTPKGAGTLQVGTTGAFSANGAVAVTLVGNGPTNSHSDVQKWLRILDSTGASLFLPCF